MNEAKKHAAKDITSALSKNIFHNRVAQEYSIDNISDAKTFEIRKKYQFLDKIFLNVLKKHPEKKTPTFRKKHLEKKHQHLEKNT